MQNEKNNRFSWKVLISFYIFLSFIVISISGLIIYIAPSGRIAYWSQWIFWGMTKSHWKSLHVIFTFLFIIATTLHIYFNWAIFMDYLRKKAGKFINKRRELLAAIIVSILISILTLSNFTPIVSVIKWGDSLGEKMIGQNDFPPAPYAELLSVKKFAAIIEMDVNDLMVELKNNGYNVKDENAIIKEIAKKYNIHPRQLLKSVLKEIK